MERELSAIFNTVIMFAMPARWICLVVYLFRLKVLYILKLFQDPAINTAHISGISEFVLGAPCLSYAIIDISR